MLDGNSGLILVCLLLLAPSSTLAQPTQGSSALVITTDCGADMDDQWAIAHASLAPELRPCRHRKFRTKATRSGEQTDDRLCSPSA